MKKKLSTLLLSMFSLAVFSQQAITPPAVWYKADNPNNTGNLLNDLSGNNHPAIYPATLPFPDTTLFNYNKAYLQGANAGAFRVGYIPSANEEMTLITVYKCNTPTLEQNIWTMYFDSSRVANLTTQKITTIGTKIKYIDTTSTKAIINTTRPKWKNITDTLGHYILLGSSDSLNYSGKLAEFMLFDKPLSETELLKTHTYLAIKYGISLYKSNYLSSSDSIIWNYQENINFDKEIAGIGRDTVLGLNQKQSSADGGDNILCIAANAKQTSNLQNNHTLNRGDFLIWSCNGGSITQTSADTIHPNQLGGLPDKKWLMQVSGNTSRSIPTQVVLNGSQFDTLGRCFIVIDRSATGNFSQANSQIIEADSIDANKNIYFSNLYWDPDLSGKDMFTFILGNKLTLFASTRQSSDTTGALDLEVIGGTAPFTYSLTSGTTGNSIFWNSSERTQTKPNLTSGIYIAKVLDIKGNTDFRPIEITISENTSSYSTLPNGTSSDKEPTAGNTVNDCRIYPNPSRGNYTISISQKEITPVEIRIYDDLGKLVDYKKESGSSHYSINGHLETDGNYLIEILTDRQHRFYKLVIN